MKKDLIFFGESGLTSTSANFICNLAKEFIQNLEYTINNISFINSNVTLIGNSNRSILSEGINKSKLNTISEHLNSIAEAKSLIAWLREGIKAKDTLLKEIKNTSLSKWCVDNGFVEPESPEKEEVLDEDTYISNLSIKERNRYYELETICAVYGKYIHPDGHFSDARKLLINRIQHPHELSGSGRDALLYTYTPTVTTEDVDATFFELQNYYRAAQAELNGIKHKMEEAIQMDDLVKSEAYAEALAKYSDEKQLLSSKMNTWKLNESKKIQEAKIVIPNSLKNIYDVISALGKDKDKK